MALFTVTLTHTILLLIKEPHLLGSRWAAHVPHHPKVSFTKQRYSLFGKASQCQMGDNVLGVGVGALQDGQTLGTRGTCMVPNYTIQEP